MRILLTVDSGIPHDLGRHVIIIEPATAALARQLRDAAATDPDEILSIPNARIHVVADPGTASVLAGNIVAVREEH